MSSVTRTSSHRWLEDRILRPAEGFDCQERDALDAVFLARVAGLVGDELVRILAELLDPQARPRDRVAISLLLGRSPDARGPQVHIADDRLLQLLLGDDVGNRDATARPQHPGHLGENLVLVRRQIDYPVGDHAVDALIVHGQALDPRLAKLDLVESGLGGELARLVELLDGEIDSDYAAGRFDLGGGEEGVHPRAAAEVDDALARLHGGEVEEVADPG